MKNEFLVIFHRLLQVANGNVLVVAVSNEDATRSIQISNVISVQVGNVSSIINNNRLKSYN